MKFPRASKATGASSPPGKAPQKPIQATEFIKCMIKLSHNYDAFSRFLEFIDQPTFVCMGLTCKGAYEVYQRYRTGNASLEASHMRVLVAESGYVVRIMKSRVLYRLLEDWCGPGYHYCHARQKFVKVGRWGRKCSHWHTWARVLSQKKDCEPCGCAYAEGKIRWVVTPPWARLRNKPTNAQIVYHGGEYWPDAATGSLLDVGPDGKLRRRKPADPTSCGLPGSLVSRMYSPGIRPSYRPS